MNVNEFLNINPHELPSEMLNDNDNNFITVSSNYLSININTINATTNSGSISDANSYRILYGWPNTPGTAYTTVRIDGINYIYGFDGVLVKKPVNITPFLSESSWKYDDILVTQTIQIVFNPYTNKHDMGKYSYKVTNLGSRTHSVGIRIMYDTMIDFNDGPDFVIANSSSPLEYETEFIGDSIPKYFNAYKDYPVDLNTLSLGILKDDNIISPSKVVFGRFFNVYSNPWDIPNLTNTLRRRDNAVAIYFGELNLKKDKYAIFSNFYGLGTVVSLPFEDTVTLTTSEESCIIDNTATVDVYASSNIFAYKYSYTENDCAETSLVRGNLIGFTLVFGNYGPLDYTASTSENTIVDLLSVPSPMSLEVVSISKSDELTLLDLTTGNEILVGSILSSGDHSIQVLKLLLGSEYSGAFNIEANTIHSISILLQIKF